MPGRDGYNGDQLKQELLVHRESATGDVVQLNMLRGTHFTARSSDAFVVGKVWGAWLWYLVYVSAFLDFSYWLLSDRGHVLCHQVTHSLSHPLLLLILAQLPILLPTTTASS